MRLQINSDDPFNTDFSKTNEYFKILNPKLIG